MRTGLPKIPGESSCWSQASGERVVSAPGACGSQVSQGTAPCPLIMETICLLTTMATKEWNNRSFLIKGRQVRAVCKLKWHWEETCRRASAIETSCYCAVPVIRD